MTFNQIAEELNKKGYLSARGKETFYRLKSNFFSLNKHYLLKVR